MTSYKPLVLLANGRIGQLPDGATLQAKVQEVDVVEMQAKEVLVAGMAVYCSAAYQVMKAKADDAATVPVLGLAASNAALDAYVNIVTDGVLELADWTQAAGSAALEIGTSYYLDTTAGVLTGTVPTTGHLVYVGRAITPQKMEISIQQPITL